MPNIKLPDDFPRRLRALRSARHMSETDLAHAAGLTYRTVRELETGKRCRVMERTLHGLSSALGVTIEELLQGHGESSVAPVEPSPPPPTSPRRTAPADRREVAAGAPRRAWWSRPLVHVVVAALIAVALLAWLDRYGRQHARVEHGAHHVTVRHGLLGRELWHLDVPAGVKSCQFDPGDPGRLLIGLDGFTPDGGRILCLDVADGDTLWCTGPDLTALERAFGIELVRSANFRARWVGFGHVDDDDELDIVARFQHGLYFPTALVWLDRDGHVRAQYLHRGHLTDIIVLDIDTDGRDEIAAFGTNNAADVQGGSIVLLEEGAWGGGPPHDGSRIRLDFPAFPRPFMEQLGTPRLSCYHSQITEDASGNMLMVAHLGPLNGPTLTIFLDEELRVLSGHPSDMFLAAVASWPDSLQTAPGPARSDWLENWLAGHHRYEDGQRQLAPDRERSHARQSSAPMTGDALIEPGYQ